MKKNIIVTGVNGYVGAMIVNELLKNDQVNLIIGIDKDFNDPLLNNILEDQKQAKTKRFYFIQQNLDNKNLQNMTDKWEVKVLDIFKQNNIKVSDCVIIHTAWQIREIYGDRQKSWDWNIIASQNVFDFAFNNNIERLIYFSTVASYGAFKDNKIDYHFTEKDKFRKTKYLYSEEKRVVEENLLKSFCLYKKTDTKNNSFNYDKNILTLTIDQYKNENLKTRDSILMNCNNFLQTQTNSQNNESLTEVVILRPAAITGPRGRAGRIRFGLQSALSGTLKKQNNIFYNLVTMMTTFVPVTDKWLRQFIHEDDVFDIVEMAIFNSNKSLGLSQYEVYNISPLGDCVLKHDMAKAVNKKMIKVSPYLIRLAFFVLWYITRGKIPTSEGSWKGYSYPIAVSGQKIVTNYKYNYKFDSKTAFVTKEGRYSFYFNQ